MAQTGVDSRVGPASTHFRTPSRGSGRHPEFCAGIADECEGVRDSKLGEVEGEKAAETELRGLLHPAAEHCPGQGPCPGCGCVKIHLS